MLLAHTLEQRQQQLLWNCHRQSVNSSVLLAALNHNNNNNN